MINCPNCGVECNEADMFCGNCGTAINVERNYRKHKYVQNSYALNVLFSIRELVLLILSGGIISVIPAALIVIFIEFFIDKNYEINNGYEIMEHISYMIFCSSMILGLFIAIILGFIIASTIRQNAKLNKIEEKITEMQNICINGR